ncbi:MAG: hypothetical protein ACK4N5_17955, partial [Myxococcales bacterium]
MTTSLRSVWLPTMVTAAALGLIVFGCSRTEPIFCSVDEDCPEGLACFADRCIDPGEQVIPPRPCASGRVDCGDGCTDLQSDGKHCGACNQPCENG